MPKEFYLDYKEKGVNKEMVQALANRLKGLFDDALSAAEQGQPYAMAARLGEAKHTLQQFDIFFNELVK